MLKIMALTAVALTLPLAGCERVASSDCMAGRRGALIAGGFTGAIVCEPEDATFVLVGRVQPGDYSIYDYRYRFMPQHGAVKRGGQRIVVFKGDDYVGQYSLSPPPYVDLDVQGSRVSVESSDPSHAYLDFSDGPPNRVFIDGYVLDLYR